MKRVLFVLIHVACKILRKFAVFFAYSVLAATGTASIALSLMYFADEWREWVWTNSWVPVLAFLLACAFFAVAALYFLLLLIPQTRKHRIAKATGRLSYILCVAFVGTFATVLFLLEPVNANRIICYSVLYGTIR